MGPREKQQARAITPPPASPKGGKGGKATKASEKSKKRTQEAPPASPPARGRRAGASQVSDAAQDALEALKEAQVMAMADNDKTPSPPPPSRGGGGLTDRQEKQAEEQKARNDAKVIADLNAKLAAANAHWQLKLASEKDKKRKESSSGESANPGRRQKLSNASTRRKQVPIFRFNYFSGCHFFDGLSVHRQSLILLTLIMPIL